MKRIHFAAALMIPLLLLAGCGEREAKLERRFAAFPDAIAATAVMGMVFSLAATAGTI